ncbi:alpha/beta hydrolase [Roseobacter sp.]|uniref:alpha/beta fold hydrolase n=1 Tax=Roseobacter sp. TaxID=1907202 RepID=UPI0025E270C9|nr:alpha/beta hydrolase [Roseobacter sp.]
MSPDDGTAGRTPRAPAAPDWSLEEFRQSAQNLIRVRSINPRGFHTIACQVQGRDTGLSPVICVHGLTRHGGDFEQLARMLADRRRVICPDLVGRGASDWLPDASDYHIAQYNCDLTAVMAATGCDGVDWVGTSLGGLCGIMMAGMPGSPIRRLIVNDVAPEVPVAALRRVSAYLSEPLRFAGYADVEPHIREVYQGFGPMNDADWQEMARTSVYRDANGAYAPHFDPGLGENFRRYWLLYHFNLWSYWKRITCPVMIIRGTGSDFLTPGLLAQMLEHQPGAQVLELDGVGHTPVTNHPSVSGPVRDWLDAT